MFKVVRVDEDNKQIVIDFLRFDVLRHVFAFCDIQQEPEHTIMYAAFEDETLKGYILIYTALEFPSLSLECDKDTAESLIEYSPRDRFIMHIPPDCLPIIKRKFPLAKHYVEDWMLVKEGEACFFESKLVRKLCINDASRLASLLSSVEDRPMRSVKKCVDMISKQPIYGVFADAKLVSCAGSFIQLPQVWMIGKVYTHPEHRNKGYATLATSAVTREALENSEAAALFVGSDNYTALKVYGKIGYKKIGEKLWIDVGTGMKP